MIPKTEIPWLSATEIVDLTTTGRLTVSEIAEAMIDHVELVNPGINAIVDFDPEQVRHDAMLLDEKFDRNDHVGPLFGVPFTIKDLTAVKGRKLTFGLAAMADNIADQDAPVVERLYSADALYLGKTNTPETAYYGGTDNHLYGPTHNPWKHGYTAGGSSGGASVAVAAGMGPIAEGSDGAGSVRIPSAMCGVLGMKPSAGVIPQTIFPGRFSEWAYHGPISRTVEDNALLLDVMSGPCQERVCGRGVPLKR